MPTSTMIKLTNVRLSYPHIARRKKFKNEPEKPGKFQATFILDPDNEAHVAIMNEVKTVAKGIYDEQWPKGAKLKSRCYKINKAPDENDDDAEDVSDEYLNMFTLSSSEDHRPEVRDASGRPVAEDDNGFPYAGCYVNGYITMWTQDNEWGKRINANLLAVQFHHDGDKFSSRPDASAIDFDDMSSQGGTADSGSGDDPLAF